MKRKATKKVKKSVKSISLKKKTAKKIKKSEKPKNLKKRKSLFLTSGSKSLDKHLGKGIVDGSSVLILGNPHSGKKPLLMKMVKENCCDYGYEPIIVLTDIGVNNWVSMAKMNRWYCEKKNCRIFYIDSYSQQFNVCVNSQNVKCLEVPFTLSSLSIAISDYIESVKKDGRKPFVVLHSISTLFEMFNESEVYSFIQFLLGKLKLEGVTIVATMQLGVHGENTETSIASLFDCVIKMNNGMLSANGYITIKDKEWHKYKFVKNELKLLD